MRLRRAYGYELSAWEFDRDGNGTEQPNTWHLAMYRSEDLIFGASWAQNTLRTRC